jgi:hypothetical protein
MIHGTTNIASPAPGLPGVTAHDFSTAAAVMQEVFAAFCPFYGPVRYGLRSHGLRGLQSKRRLPHALIGLRARSRRAQIIGPKKKPTILYSIECL